MVEKMDYAWDVFISYPRRDPVGPWVQDHFYPLLQKWMGAAMQQAPRVFIDKKMEDGTHWPTHLRESLHHSKCMMAILAPPYFGSNWCLAEWKTMQDRHGALGLGIGSSVGLIQPIRYFDGDTFPEEAKAIQDAHSDYREFNAFPPGRGGQKSKGYKLFEQKLKDLSERVALRLLSAPAWRGDWPQLVIPQPPAPAAPLRFNQVSFQ